MGNLKSNVSFFSVEQEPKLVTYRAGTTPYSLLSVLMNGQRTVTALSFICSLKQVLRAFTFFSTSFLSKTFPYI